MDALPFVGQKDRRLDQKDRVVIPAAFATVIAERHAGRLYLVPSATEPCLEAYPARVFESQAARQVPQRFDGDARDQRLFFQNAELVELKGPGRITIPSRFHDFFPAGVVRVAGMNTYLELWDPDTWEERLGTGAMHLPKPRGRTKRG